MTRKVRGFVWLWALALAGLLAGPARADSGDVIKDYRIVYTIHADGSVGVVEDIDYAFAASDRHGIYRLLITRQPFSSTSDRDVVYAISDMHITSPDASAKVDDSVHWKGFRTSWIEYKIGDKNTEIGSQRAHYHLAYTVRGALRTTKGQPEFYWNATGNDWTAAIAKLRIEVHGPGAATHPVCYQGAAGATQRCAADTTHGVAIYTATGLTDGQGVTVAALFPKGSIADATPTTVPGGSLLGNARVTPVTVGAGALALLLAAVAALRVRFMRRDRRFAGTPPGVVAPPGTASVKDTVAASALPVQFNPPEISPALGGTLLDPDAAKRVTATVLIELAVQGVIGIAGSRGTGRRGRMTRTAYPRDLTLARSGYQAALVNALYPSAAAAPINLDDPESGDRERFAKADQRVRQAVESEIAANGWMTGKSSKPGCLVLLLLLVVGVAIVYFGFTTGGAGWIWGAPAALVGLLLLVAAGRWGRGYRSPVGRALTDQVAGFRRYLATAEAGQLRFEEGEDIFSKYLPWAIVFDIADRWQRVCAELAAAGRIPATPGWYDNRDGSGGDFYSSYSGSDFGSSLASATASNSASSGSSGGGSSGGGGGGGGGGSW